MISDAQRSENLDLFLGPMISNAQSSENLDLFLGPVISNDQRSENLGLSSEKVQRSEDSELIVEGSNRTLRQAPEINPSQKLITIYCFSDSARAVRVQLEYCTENSHTILHRERESESTVMTIH